jgi:Protein of unknown function (DUF4089)
MTRKMRRKPKKAAPSKPATHRRRDKPVIAAGTAAKPSRKTRTAGAGKRASVIETLVAANAQTLALAIEPAWRAGVQRNLRLLLAHAMLVDQFALPEGIEPAPVFHA